MGRDLIKAAEVRAQVTQVEQYQQAVNTFYGKYGYLPGDMPNAQAAQFNFATPRTFAGEGDGNGVIEGVYSHTTLANMTCAPFSGEQAMFWVDLSTAKLIDGRFSTATPTTNPEDSGLTITGSGVNKYFPSAKLGNGGYVYVWSGGWSGFAGSGDGKNYFAVTGVTGSYSPNMAASVPSMTVAQAYSIDKKTDDGLPQSGKVMAMDGFLYWASGGPVTGSPPYGSNTGDYEAGTFGPITPSTSSPVWDDTPPSSIECYYNTGNNSVSSPENYNLSYPNNLNCSLSFQFQ